MKLNTRKIRTHKLHKHARSLQMLTCYDYQSASILNETELDLILVGDSLGNVILGYETTVEVTIEEMTIFSKAVRRGAPDKFIVTDMPFGSYSSFDQAISNACQLFQKTKTDSLKLEGATQSICQIIKRLTETGIPVMGHIGLTPQSVHELGGYYTHGKNENAKKRIMDEALRLQDAGCFSIVLECVEENLAKDITQTLSIPTIGIGAGRQTDGQVLVINDLLKMGKATPPSFCQPIHDFFTLKKELITDYLAQNSRPIDVENNSHH